MNVNLKGSIVAIVTPMMANGDLDLRSLRRLVDWHIDSGTKAIVAVGTTGESATVDINEYKQIISTVVEQSSARIPIIAGNGAPSTKKSIELTKIATALGANACLCATPYYNRPEQIGLLRHYQAVAEAEKIAQILYNVPSRTAVDLLPETVAELAQIENVIGLKEAVEKPQRQRELIRLVGDKIDLLSGDDNSCLEFMLAGAKGVISVTANIAPKMMAQMCDYALADDIDKATLLNQKLQGLHQDLFLESNPIPSKWLLSKMGKIDSGIRLPLTPFSQHHFNQLTLSAEKAGINVNESGEV